MFELYVTKERETKNKLQKQNLHADAKQNKASAMEMHLFNDQLWDTLSFHINHNIKSIITSITSKTRELRGEIVFNYLSM